jgi:16S rRNA (guanine966-N2)-methyltransferase
MIITGGEARGRRIASPDNLEVRPTSSKIRQAFFNILGARIQDARFLDIFAGSGLIGFEALSRGAQSLVAIEESKRMVAAIRKSAKILGFENAAEVLQGDFRRAIEWLPQGGFDIAYADPPYKSPFPSSVVHLFDRNQILTPGGILAIEHAKGYQFPEDLISIKFIDSRSYGQTGLSFFEQT